VTIRIEIDRDKCVGSGNCVFWAPGTFDLDDEGQSVVIDPDGETEERIRVAAEGCPAQAITVVLDALGPEEEEEVSLADRPDR
jgi:ferredoxin